MHSRIASTHIGGIGIPRFPFFVLGISRSTTFFNSLSKTTECLANTSPPTRFVPSVLVNSTSKSISLSYFFAFY